MGKLPKKILLFGGVALLVVWLWPFGGKSNPNQSRTGELVAGESRENVGGNGVSGSLSSVSGLSASSASAVQAISSPKLTPAPKLTQVQSEDLQARFTQANQLLAQGNEKQAIEVFKALTADFPNFVEPYVNLAATYAKAGDLDQARSVLAQATNANQSTRVLFESINKLHGALAAQAYQNALESGGDSTAEMNLPTASQLATDFELTQQVKQLAANLQNQQTIQNANAVNSSELKKLKADLLAANQIVETNRAEHQQSILTLQNQLDAKTQQAGLAQNQLSKMQVQVEQAESDLLAKMRIELSNAETALVDKQQALDQLTALNSDLTRKLVALESLAATVAAADTQAATSTANTNTATTTTNSSEKDTAVVEPVTNPVAVTSEQAPSQNAQQQINADQEQAAIKLVQAWASSWSSQDVTRYISFYADNYSSSPNQTHQAWIDQRRVRLTNKKFIQVNVSNFKVSKVNNGFAVTFTQNYRSNTLDDTIVKKIQFALPSDDDWQSAKIVSERIIRL